MYDIKRLFVHEQKVDYDKWKALLHESNLHVDKQVDYVIGLFAGEHLIGTGALFDNVLKCLAIKEDYKGEGLLNRIVTDLLNKNNENGQFNAYVYTKPENQTLFLTLGFKPLVNVDQTLLFMEKAINDFDTYLNHLAKSYVPGEKIAAIVMNANPFTKGHQFLVETASKENDVVHVFVVSENRSEFSNTTRLELVKKGCRHFSNVYVHETGPYMVSAQTFPSYFLKEPQQATYLHAKLDAMLFKERIAPVLQINRRYLGEEPISEKTEIYNHVLKNVLQNEIKVIIIPRLTIEKTTVSASLVRALLEQKDFAQIKKLVPETTYRYLIEHENK